MFRVGRDNKIIHFNSQDHDVNSVLCFAYGEVDCRCHIKRQILLNRAEDEVIEDIVKKFVAAIYSNVVLHKKVVIVAVVPPIRQSSYEKVHGTLISEFPFVGTDEERVGFTNKMNIALKRYSELYGYAYFNPYEQYTDEDGTLKYELSDTSVHIGNNNLFLKHFLDLLDTFG
jgi:hypothetical protein